MRILYVAPDIYPHTVGGFGIHFHETSKEQVRLGHSVTAYTVSECVEPEYTTDDSFYIQNFKSLIKVLGNSLMLSILFNLLEKQSNYDTSCSFPSFFSANLCAVARKRGQLLL